MDAQVIVVGGGPAGASTAWHLARAGVDVLVLERARFPRDKPCAEYLSPQASRILANMGALEPCERSGAAHLAGMIVRAPNGSRIQGDYAASHGFTGFRDRGLALPRPVLDAILLDRSRAAGARVQEGVRVSDVVRDARGAVRGVRVQDALGSAREIRACVVVGADGLRSVVSRRLGLGHTARAPRRIALVCHYRGVDGITSYGEMHVERDGYVGLADVGGGVTNVAMVLPARAVRDAAAHPAQLFDRWLGARPHLAPRFARAERTSPVRAVGPFARHARRATMAGAALVGDAADFFDPFTGEGIFAALRGGELLAPAVLDSLGAATPGAARRALARYDTARRHAFGGKWRVERLVGLATAYPMLMNRVARTLARRKELADLLVGVAGDFVPPREVLSIRYLAQLLLF
ncbi:MAG TPA: NAD(P)/FAD-dependent oxidoreductase [Gemmatimonadaceae bacterium]|nr:NAD(P)/FAD-dependent oxidoreductase [Gemmatimonadaceae bacterium]